MFTAKHDPRSPKFDVHELPIVIEEYVWIGSRALILPGVLIRIGAVVSAGAVITKNVDQFTIVGGIPVKKIGERTKDLNYNPAYRMYFG